MLVVTLLSYIAFYYLQNFFNQHKPKTPCSNTYLIIYSGCLLLNTVLNLKTLFSEDFDLIYLFYAILYLLGFIMIVSLNKYTVKYILFLVSFTAFWFTLGFVSSIESASYVKLCYYAIEGGLIATVFWIVPNYIYFIKRRNLFEPMKSNASDVVIDETIEDMKKDLATALQTGDYELAKVIKERIETASNLNSISDNDSKNEKHRIKHKTNNSNTLVLVETVCSAISTFLFFATGMGTSIFYVYTLYILFVDHGFWQGFVGMCLPVISSIYLCIAYWIDYGFYNNVTNFGAILVLLFIVGGVLMLIAELIASKRNN